eukprot:COSAG04_NODE_16114_length_509_cov_1.114634_2_plen_27_part_01
MRCIAGGEQMDLEQRPDVENENPSVRA